MPALEPQPVTTSSVPPLVAGLKACCPRCGLGPLFRNILALRESCPACGLDYRFIDTGDGPAIFAILILGLLMLGGALWLEFRFEPPIWVHVLAWGIGTPVMAVALLRLLKGTLVALQFHHKAEEGRRAGSPEPGAGPQ